MKLKAIHIIIFLICLLFFIQMSELPFDIVGFGFVLSILTLVNLFALVIKTKKEETTSEIKANLSLMIPIISVIIFYPLNEYLGWYISSLTLMILFQLAFKVQSKIRMISTAAVWTFFNYAVFHKILGIQFQLGTLWEKLWIQ
ncbi:MAG: tripartite tricarboxylate transporter TctB family protein [Oligoflexia bacterium]|nr:tripartite tricarboxylate transporter TctB family protein [Oligoflexia bacterium]